MLYELTLENFKAFGYISLPFNKVNLLTGLNGAGKSSVIQALLLPKQSFSNPGNDLLLLNGDYTGLGTGQDILYESASNDTIRICPRTEKGLLDLRFKYQSRSDRLESEGALPPREDLQSFFDRIYYLSAARIIPESSYRLVGDPEVRRRDFGRDGMFALQYLEAYGSKPVENKHLLLSSEEQNTLLTQTSLWMDTITPGANVEVIINRTLQSAELRYTFREGDQVTNSYRSTNVGFGLTYVLPIIVQLLTAKPGDTVMLENPEAHIHPAGQTKLGEMIACAGADGVQLIVETHSDHILNGLRLAVKRKKLSSDSVNLFYFYKDKADRFLHKVKMPRIFPNGQLSDWPKGFMDEWESALLELI